LSIEKFTGSFSKEKSGCSIFVNETIQNIRCPMSLAIYVYLLSKPDNWRLNVKELSNHFSKNKETIYKYLNSLISMGAIVKHTLRQSGKFASFEYEIKLNLTQHDSSPVTEKPCTVKPCTVKPDTYKTKNKQNKEYTNNIFNKNKNDYENDSLSLYDAQPKELTKTKKKKTKSLELVENNNPHDVPLELIQDFIEVRKAKRAPLTKTAVKQLNNELSKCVSLGIDPIQALELAVSNGWTTVKADWISKNETSKTGRPDVNSRGWSKRNPEDIF